MSMPAVPTVTSTEEMKPVRRWLTSTLLILFTMTMAAICVVLLSTTLTQTRLSTLTIDGVPVSIHKLNIAAQAWAKSRKRRNQYAAQLENAEQEQLLWTRNAGEAAAEVKIATKALENILSGFNHALQRSDPELAMALNKKSHADQVGVLQGAREQVAEKQPHLVGTIAEIEKRYESYREAERNQIAVGARTQSLAAEIKLLTERKGQADTAIEAAFELIQKNLDEADRARVENAFYEITVTSINDDTKQKESWRAKIVRNFYRLLTIQPDLLTLFLVIFMGVLGSALQITHAFFIRNEAYSIGRYFQRISVGALTALVIFIVAKAGIPVIAEPSRLTGEASVNPYFISFLAIISGLLSENAITYVQAQGTRLFGQAAGMPRWTRTDLTTEMSTQNLSPDPLARQLGIGSTILETKLKGEQEMSVNEQDALALYLRRDPRDLFTDIPPPRK